MKLEIIDRATSGAAAATLLLLGALVAGCAKEAPAPPAPVTSAATEAPTSSAASLRPAANPERNAYFGDVHVHTGWSFDAFTNGSRATPTYAYAWAQGQEITNSGLAGVRAEENTREAIFDAMQRRDTFGTSGTMIKVRFFGG